MDGMVALLVPFLVIGLVALAVAVVVLRARRASVRRMASEPTPHPEREWSEAPGDGRQAPR